jgi:hypothetical protein
MGAGSSAQCNKCWASIDPPPQDLRVGETYKVVLEPDQKYFGRLLLGPSEATLGTDFKAGNEKIIAMRVTVNSGEVRHIYMVLHERTFCFAWQRVRLNGVMPCVDRRATAGSLRPVASCGADTIC